MLLSRISSGVFYHNRFYISNLKEPDFLLTRFGASLSITLLFASLYLGRKNDQQGLRDLVAMLFVCILSFHNMKQIMIFFLTHMRMHMHPT